MDDPVYDLALSLDQWRFMRRLISGHLGKIPALLDSGAALLQAKDLQERWSRFKDFGDVLVPIIADVSALDATTAGLCAGDVLNKLKIESNALPVRVEGLANGELFRRLVPFIQVFIEEFLRQFLSREQRSFAELRESLAVSVAVSPAVAAPAPETEVPPAVAVDGDRDETVVMGADDLSDAK